MGKFKSSPWLKLLLVIAFLAVIFIALRFFNVDFSKITVESFKEKIDSFGIWGPVIYIVLYVFRPLILFPAAVFSASAGAITCFKRLMKKLTKAINNPVEFSLF